MYTEYYNLKDKPFNLSPSSKYLYLGDIHKEALALLTYGVIERMGFILLTGEVGTGKTTMVHALLNSLGDDVQCVYLSNPLFSVNDFMDYLAFSAFKKKVHFRSKADFLIRFESFLRERLQNQKNFILIIDEAQKLSIELLEEIRLLSNMETADEKLINIFLIGQPELNDTLNSMECRPLLQRISVRYHIKPLDLTGTSNYILARLKMAGAADDSRILPKNTIKEIYKYSGGFPRMINILADNTLLLGYSRGIKKLTPEMVKECYNDLQLSNSPFTRVESSEKNSPSIEKSGGNRKGNRIWKLILFLLLIGAAVLCGAYGKDIYLHFTDVPSAEKDSIQPDKTVQPLTHKSDNIPIPEEKSNSINESIHVSEKENYETINTESNTAPDESLIIQEPQERSVTVKPGNNLARLTMAAYGYVNSELLDFIKKKNPEIDDINVIAAGQVIKFPPLDEPSSHQIYTIHISSFEPFEKAKEVFNSLIEKGYEAYLMPVYDRQKEKVFRITLGSFESWQKANEYANEIREKGISGYTDIIRLEAR